MAKKYLAPQTVCDLVTTYTVFVDGKKLGGVKEFKTLFNIEGPLHTEVVLRLAVKRDSLKISAIPGKPGLKRIDFSTTNEAFK